MNDRTLPDYEKIAIRLYNLIVNEDIGLLSAVAEIEHELTQAQQVGITLGKEYF